MTKPSTSPPTRPGPLARLIRWTMRRPGAALLIFWPTAFVFTHIPPWRARNPDARPPLIPLDKIAHFAGFATLAWLLVHLLSRRFRPALAAALTLAAAAGYGLIDELSQPPFGREADPWDYAANLIGCGVGIALALLARREHATFDKGR